MRKTCSSSKCSWTIRFSSCAVARSVPNGFSTMMRRQCSAEVPFDSPAAPSCSITVAYADGGIARGKPLAAREPVDRGQQLAAGEIAGGPEDDERGRAGCRLETQPVLQRI